MNYSKQIFKMLGIEPDERFDIKGRKGKYFLTSDLYLIWEEENNPENWCTSDQGSILALLRGDVEMISSIPWTADEKIVAKFAKLNGAEFIAKDNNGCLYLCEEEPVKKDNGNWGVCAGKITRITVKMPHITTGRVYSVDEIIEGK